MQPQRHKIQESERMENEPEKEKVKGAGALAWRRRRLKEMGQLSKKARA